MEYRMCTCCVMDTSDPEIVFDSEGVCNHCRTAKDTLKKPPFALSPEEKANALSEIVDEVKKRGKGRPYDCLIGLSGGVDSSFVAYKVKSLGLRPLAVHLDNGWDSEISVKNIENICNRLGIELYTVVLDWEQFKKLQVAFLRASTPDSEIPSDHAINSSLYQIANKQRIRTIISGCNMATESILPPEWSQGHFDWKYIKAVNREFGGADLRAYPHYGYLNWLFLKTGKGLIPSIRIFHLLNYVEYQKTTAKELIMKELGWQDYGRKHGESNYTRIFQEYILPVKFGYDKRKAHLSSLIAAGQMTRAEALEELKKPIYEDSRKAEEDITYLCRKLAISRAEFDAIMRSEKKSMHDYPNHQDAPFTKLLQGALKLARGRQ